MRLTTEQALQDGVAAHKEGKLKEAEKFYRDIIQSQPKHPIANHNLGSLAVSMKDFEKAIPYFKIAIEGDPQREQYWVSCLETLTKLDRLKEARGVFRQAKAIGLMPNFEINKQNGETDTAAESIIIRLNPSLNQIDELNSLYLSKQFKRALEKSTELLNIFPNSSIVYEIRGLIYSQIAQFENSLKNFEISIELLAENPVPLTNCGILMARLGNFEKAQYYFRRALIITPTFEAAVNNYGNTLRNLGHYNDGIDLIARSLVTNRDNHVRYNTLGTLFLELGKSAAAKNAFRQALILKPDLSKVYWNLHSYSKTIDSAVKVLRRENIIDKNHIKASETRSYLDFVQRDCIGCYEPTSVSLSGHYIVRSLKWLASLPNKPKISFNRWTFFDNICGNHSPNRPFYEFGVWTGVSFRYLRRYYDFGYGFDSFEGLPENWHHEQKGRYTAYGKIPNIAGAKFIVGDFKDTLPEFFMIDRPMASVIHFDADLYSSTKVAIKNCKQVIDDNTILIFDNFFMSYNWEKDEFLALSEFCEENKLLYEVIEICLFSRQVAVRLGSS